MAEADEGLRQRRTESAPATDSTEDATGAKQETTGNALQDEPAATTACKDNACSDGDCKKKRREKTGLGIRIIKHPLFKAFTFSIVCVVPVFGVLFVLNPILDKLGWSSLMCTLHTVFAIWISVMFCFNFAATQLTSPGLTDLVQPAKPETGQYRLAPLIDGDNEAGYIYYAANWCDSCNRWKPPRTHHCSICNACVIRMDHHCPFTTNCIGMRNHGHFVLMYIFAMIGITYSMTMCILAIHHDWRPMHHAYAWANFDNMVRRHPWMLPSRDTIPAPPWLYDAMTLAIRTVHGCFFNRGHLFLTHIFTHLTHISGAVVMLQTVFSGLAMLAVFGCGCPALSIVLHGVTTIELRFPMKEYVQIKPSVYCPLGLGFYKQSAFRNFRDIFGDNWKLRLFLPVRGNVSLEPAIMPVPHPLGVTMIRQRIKEVETEGVKHKVASVADLGINAGPKKQSEESQSTQEAESTPQ